MQHLPTVSGEVNSHGNQFAVVPTRVWQAPALSSLVSRLNQPGASPNSKMQPHSPGKASPFASPAPALPEQVYLDASSDDEEVAPARSEATAAAETGSEPLSIYTAAAEPFKALLASIHNPPGKLSTHSSAIMSPHHHLYAIYYQIPPNSWLCRATVDIEML